MVFKRYYNLFYFLLFAVSACGMISCKSVANSDITPIESNRDVMYVDLDHAKKCDKVLYSSFLDKPRTILLETTERCVVREITALDVYKHKIYILDGEMNRLYVFDMNGKYLYNIGKLGKGHGEYLTISDFSIDRKNNVVYVWDESQGAALRFNLATRQFEKLVRVAKNGDEKYCMQYYDGFLYLNRASFSSGDGDYLLEKVDTASGICIAKYLEASRYNKGWDYPLRQDHSCFYSRNTDNPKFFEMFSDTIVTFSKKGIYPYVALTSDKFVTNADVTEFKQAHSEKDMNHDIQYFMNKGLTFFPSSYVENKHSVWMNIMMGNNLNYLFYDKENKSAVLTEVFTNDYICKNFNMPLEMPYYSEKGVMCIIRPAFMPYFVKDVIQTGKLNKSIDGYSQLNKLSANSNPVLFFHKFKAR